MVSAASCTAYFRHGPHRLQPTDSSRWPLCSPLPLKRRSRRSLSSSSIATILGRRLINGTIYELKLVRRGIDWKRVRRPHALERVRVSSVVRQASVIADVSDTVASVAERLHGTSEAFVPVVERDGRFAGVVAAGDIGWLMAHEGLQPIGTFAKAVPATLSHAESLERAADLMADPKIAMLPILRADGSLEGIITRRDVLIAYRSSHGA